MSRYRAGLPGFACLLIAVPLFWGVATHAAADAIDIPGEGQNVAYDQPAKLAWTQFVALNTPLTSGGPAGASGTLWESWAAAEEVFADPDTTPQWPTTMASGGSEEGLLQQTLFAAALDDGAVADFRRPALLAAHTTADAGEVRFNRTAFDWIVLKQLWYLQGQQKWFDLHAAHQPVDVEFPAGSTLVKAAWKPIQEADKPRFHWRQEDGQLWGLTALHITSKILPGWFWATFEQVDNPDYTLVRHPDPFGLEDDAPSSELVKLMVDGGLDPSVWTHYRLDGTQMDYVDLEGAPIVLGNSIIEAGFTAVSSCRTCHVRASIGEGGSRLSFAPVVGAPDPAWFETPARPPVPRFLRLDFAWSLARAKVRTQAASGPPQP